LWAVAVADVTPLEGTPLEGTPLRATIPPGRKLINRSVLNQLPSESECAICPSEFTGPSRDLFLVGYTGQEPFVRDVTLNLSPVHRRKPRRIRLPARRTRSAMYSNVTQRVPDFDPREPRVTSSDPPAQDTRERLFSLPEDYGRCSDTEVVTLKLNPNVKLHRQSSERGIGSTHSLSLDTDGSSSCDTIRGTQVDDADSLRGSAAEVEPRDEPVSRSSHYAISKCRRRGAMRRTGRIVYRDPSEAGGSDSGVPLRILPDVCCSTPNSAMCDPSTSTSNSTASSTSLTPDYKHVTGMPNRELSASEGRVSYRRNRPSHSLSGLGGLGSRAMARHPNLSVKDDYPGAIRTSKRSSGIFRFPSFLRGTRSNEGSPSPSPHPPSRPTSSILGLDWLFNADNESMTSGKSLGVDWCCFC